ncbi:helix-turn-helix domain-containing protein [Clostridium thermopalmarium]|uniref:HTH-type transcriptional regulator Xre n=1 Tax=Clostridium thermopalmarium DSM 5974 TaxID=1121340 RepID=A0A2T0APD1_9CLOT|nr:helix-turn-helix transcriptional regulator [Clostridium thermopalmarium]PRR70876.1 HTH-type transcriptional regulator Xre [Clostridium thermopalmarium DSM 5974]PVZ28800.1 helix-turn-helix protein [Clostridium thermopalmarium DSM 5974]
MDNSLLGLKIKQLRSEYSLKIGKKFTQKNLADKIGISRSFLGDIESGRTIPNEETIKKIAKAMEVSPEYLLSGTVEKHPGELEELDKELKELYPKIKKLPKEELQKILDIIKKAGL